MPIYELSRSVQCLNVGMSADNFSKEFFSFSELQCFGEIKRSEDREELTDHLTEHENPFLLHLRVYIFI